MKKVLINTFCTIFTLLFCANCAIAKEIINIPQKLNYINLEYWKSFNDDILLNYVICAVKNSPTVKKASWKVEENKQLVKISLAKELPTFDVKANYLGLHIAQLDNFELEQNGFILPFSTRWELDLLLKNRDRTRSQKKIYEASIEEEKGIYISLASQVGTAYFNLIKYDKLLEYKKVYLKNLNKILELAKLKLNQGIIDTIEYTNLQNDYEKELQVYYDLKIQQEKALNSLAALIGDSADNVAAYKRKNLESYYTLEVSNIVVSSDVIFSRPDVLKAEKKLMAEKINVRIARKEFFPTFNLDGSLIFNTFAKGTFFSWNSAVAYIIAGAAQELFAGGKRIATLKAKKALYEQMFEEYKEINLNAIKEINDALCYLNNDNEILSSSQKRIQNKKNNLSKSTQKFQAGVMSLLDLLLEKNSLITTEETYINAKAKNMIDYISLYKAAGAKF